MESKTIRPKSPLSVLETGALVVAGLFLIILSVAFLPVVGILVAIPVMVMSLSFLFFGARNNQAETTPDESAEPITLFDLPVSAKAAKFSVEGPTIDGAAIAAFVAQARK